MIHRFLRIPLLAAIPFAVTLLMMINAPAQMGADSGEGASDPLSYPVILIHGLGEGPGELAFGNLEQYLEDFYFDVEVMDFNDYPNHPLVKDKDAGNLGTLAALLGAKIKDVLAEYDATKVHIVAHSYGGLVTQAYLLNYGEQYAKKKGLYESDVAKVVYIQTPFYGSIADEEVLQQMTAETDYGPFTKVVEMTRTLGFGSEYLYGMHNKLLDDNIYADEVDALALISRDDKVVKDLHGTLNAFINSDYGFQSARFRTLKNYAHSPGAIEPVGKNPSIACVDQITDENFIAIFSFLDGGSTWRKIGTATMTDNSMVMVKYEKAQGFKTISGDEVSLKYMGKASPPAARGESSLGRGDTVPAHFNHLSRVFVFRDVPPGAYELEIENSKKGNYVEEIEVDDGALPAPYSYLYDPKEHELTIGNRPISGKGCLFYLEQHTIMGLASFQQELAGLNVTNFDIEFTISNCQMNLFDKGVLVSLHNGNGTMANEGRANGSRLEVSARGEDADPAVHAGKVMLILNVDKNWDGQGTDSEFEEHKDGYFDWSGANLVLATMRTNADNHAVLSVYVNGEFVFSVDKNMPYWNPRPVLSIGGFVTHEVYKPPVGATITNLCVRNGK